MHHLVITIDVRADRYCLMLALAATHAEKSRREGGCVRFDVLQDPATPQRFILHEVWQDRDSLQAHRETAHYAAWRRQIPSLENMPRTREEYEGPDKLVLAKLLGTIAAHARAQGKSVVMTNGAYDLLHCGHVHCLSEARAAGDVLLVAVNDDDSVRRLKGPGRPIMPSEGRVDALAALSCVDYVALFSADTPVDLIRGVRPDCLVKSDQYQPSEVVGAEFAGRVLLVPHLPGYSTTRAVKLDACNG